MQKKIIRKIKELSRETGIPESIVQKVFESQFKMARETIKNIDMVNMAEEEFNNTKTNFNWKYIGKLYTKYSTIQKLKEKWQQKK